ncbi:MAG TPA: methyltransferase domain-containing protein [Nocardioides sp.]|nr:methyltransferase domain-containing protein [Nocardioides sp.]
MTESSPEAARSRKAAVGAVFDRAASGYDDGPIEFFGPAGRDLVERAGLRPGERVLDVGAGKGASAVPAAERVGPDGRVVAIDLAPAMVDALRARAEAAGLANLVAEVGDAEDPPGDAGSFDVVLSSLCLFFLPRLDVALARYHALLRPGGRLAFSWFGDDDARWQQVYDALLAGVPAEERQARRPGGGPFSSVAALEDAVLGAGFTEVGTHEVRMEVAVPDGPTWWDEQWTHGRRAQLERLAELGALEATRDRVVAAVDALREADGTLAWRPALRHTVAVA